MKFRMLILAVAVMAMSSLSFGQGATFDFVYGPFDGGSADWLPLHYNCELPTDVLQDGTVVRIMRDITPLNVTRTVFQSRSQWTGYNPADVPLPIGDDGAQHQILPTNEFVFNSAEITGAPLSSFYTPYFEYRGGTPPVQPNTGAANSVDQRTYLAIGCYDDLGVFHCMYHSSDYFIITQSPMDVLCDNYIDPEDPENINEGNVYFWTCYDAAACAPPVTEECEGYSDSLFIPWNHNDVNESCHNLCLDEDNVTHIFVGPFANYCVALYPESGGPLNVLPSENCTSTDCPDGAAVFMFDPSSPEGGNWIEVNGLWYRHFEVTIIEPGCVTIVLEILLSAYSWDCWLPVELLSFEAISGDKEVSLHWTTASETDNDHFEIEREGTVMGRVQASGSATGNAYNWSESNLINGREYTYSLVSVSTTGEREVIGTASATPSMDAATITEYALHQNYPNPFNPETNISFDIVETCDVTLTVYNSTGQTVATLVNGTMTSGRHSVSFDAASLPSGLYFYRLNAGDFTSVKKMVLMK